jgi:gliding motility associated protien GldN
MHFQTFVDKWSIPYEKNGNQYKIEDIDVPSDEVKGFYVKESSYYDQNTATYHSRIVALCPVLHRAADEFSYGGDVQKRPLFWVKYDDVKTYLSGQNVMTSNLNNAARMSMDDFFSTNHYKGEIYMTTNMQNKSLQE